MVRKLGRVLYCMCLFTFFWRSTPQKARQNTKGDYLCLYNSPKEALRLCNSCIVNEKKQNKTKQSKTKYVQGKGLSNLSTDLPNHFSLLTMERHNSSILILLNNGCYKISTEKKFFLTFNRTLLVGFSTSSINLSSTLSLIELRKSWSWLKREALLHY